MSLTFPRRWLVPVAVAAALGLAATPAAADQVRHREWWLSAVHATPSWQSSRGGGVTVAVLDSGVDPAQRDLAGSVKAGPDYTGTGEAPGSRYWGGHGTGMAALIAGHGHGPGGADGTMGIAPSARILSIRVVPDRGDPAFASRAAAARLPGSIAAGIKYAVAHGAKVIDLPLDPGTSGGAASGSAAGGSAAERDAVGYAEAKGAVLVAPAGDDKTRGGAVDYPAGYPGVVAAGAFDRNFNLAPFSSGRPYVSVSGPGVDVGTARPGSGYTTVSSTAAASAVVAGVAAMVRAEYPAFPASQVVRAITQGTSFRHAKRAGSGYGAVDAAGALRAAAAINATSSFTPASPSAPASGSSAGPATGPAGFLGNALRDLIAVALAAVIIVLFFLFWRGSRRRRRAREAQLDSPAADSPLTGGLSGPPPTEEEMQGSPGGGIPDEDRRPRLAPVTGLPGPRDAKARPSAGPPWEDAPMPSSPAPDWPAPDPAEGPETKWPALEGAPGPGSPWPSPDEPATQGENGTAIRNGQGPLSGHGAAGYGQPGDEHASARARSEGEDTQTFPALPRQGFTPSGAVPPDDQGLYEEEEPPFDDEDDRHL